MALWTPRRRVPESNVASLNEVLEQYDLVDVVAEPEHQFMVVAEKGPKVKKLAAADGADLRELGSVSTSPWTSYLRQEYNAELRGQQGLRNYDKMRRSDATVRGTLRLAKTPVLAARWFIEPASDKARDRNVADFVWNNLTKWMTMSWPQLLTETLLMLDFGYYMFEKVWTDQHPEAPGKTVWQKLAPRHPMDVLSWEYDKAGGPNGVIMAPCEGDPPDGVPIPIDKLLVFTFDKEAGNMEGISILRSAYKHWYYKDNLYKIDAIQKERHGIGVPVIKLPPNFTAEDKTLANELGRNLRTNERAHVVLPPNWELIFAKLEGQPVDALKSAIHHDEQIQKNILAPFMNGGAKDEDQVMFLKATRFIADIVQDVFNKYAIPQLVDYNWERLPNGYPQLKARRIGEQADWRTMSFAIRNLIGAGVIRPDDKLEEALREEMDLPAVDFATIRIVRSPQAGPNGGPPAPPTPSGVAPATPAPGAPAPPAPPAVGPPRQAAAGSMSITPGSTRVGLDKSGG